MKYLGAIFYFSAAIYLAVTKPLDIITVLAIVATVVIAVLSLTKYSVWSIIGGGFLIAVSLLMQSIQSYWCVDCLKADMLILAGMISLSIFEILTKGKLIKPIAILTAFMTIMLTLSIVLHTDFGALKSMIMPM